MSRVINIDEKLAAKAEINHEPIEVTFRGQKWYFSPSMPAQLPEYLADGKVVQGLTLALSKEQREEFADLAVTVDEVNALVESLAGVYGATEGESEASE
jgi:hypothetical protein